MSEEEILSSLKKLCLSDVEWIEVTRVNTKISTARGLRSNIFKIKCIASNIISALRIKQVVAMRIHLEMFKASSEVVQCFKCQAIGHISRNCWRQQRCVKCTGQHTKNECPASVNRGIAKLKCVFCGLQHPSSFIGCVKRKEEIQRCKLLQEKSTAWKKSKVEENDNLASKVRATLGCGLSNSISSAVSSPSSCHCQNAAEPTPNTVPVPATPSVRPTSRILPASTVPSKNSSLDDMAQRLFGKSWTESLLAVWRFEVTFEKATEEQKEPLMLEFITNGWKRRSKI